MRYRHPSRRTASEGACKGRFLRFLACAGDGSSPSCPFVPAIRGLDIVKLIHLSGEIEGCLAIDRHRRYDYQWVLSQTENLMMRRIAFYLISKDEMDDYADWEDRQRGIVTPTLKDNEPDTVAKENENYK
jgi:hypothetical protein